MLRLVVCLTLSLLAGAAFATPTDLLTGTSWSPAFAIPGEVTASSEAPLVVKLMPDGGEEAYPNITAQFGEPRDWSASPGLRLKVRATCGNPKVKVRHLAVVLYDELTRRADLPDHPMTQQVLDFYVPCGRWITLTAPLGACTLTRTRALSLYLYEQVDVTGEYQWEIASLELLSTDEVVGLVDGQTWPSASPPSPAHTLLTSDGFSVGFADDGRIATVAVPAGELGRTSRAPCGLLVRDAAEGGVPIPVTGGFTKTDSGFTQVVKLEQAGLEVTADWHTRGSALELSGLVRDLTGRDRAVTVYLALPCTATPWRWWDSVSISRTELPASIELSNTETGAQYGERGSHSRYPLAAVSVKNIGGLTMAIPMTEPVVHRFAFQPQLGLMSLALDFGLISETNPRGRSLAEAPFQVVLYQHDVEWGFRDALARYYALFPEVFEARAPAAGGWFCWGGVQDLPAAKEAGYGIHWGPQDLDAVRWDKAEGLLPLLYIEPEMYQQAMGDYNRAPTEEETEQRLRKLAAGDADELAAFDKLAYAHSYIPAGWWGSHSFAEGIAEISKAAVGSAIEGPDGQPAIAITNAPWGSETGWLSVYYCSLDPDLPEGKGRFARDIYLIPELARAKAEDAEYSGLALDSLGAGTFSRADYARAHLISADEPLTFSADTYLPVRAAAFATVEWIRDMAKRMHEQEKVLMANCSWGTTPAWLTFAAPYLDLFGAENPKVADPDFLRAIAWRKTCTDLPYEPQPEQAVARHLVQAVFPGMGSDPALMKKYMPLVKRLAEAGWEPLTWAWIDGSESVRIERYGQGNTVYFALDNTAETSVEARLRCAEKQIGLAGELTVTKLPTVESVPHTEQGWIVPLLPGETCVVRFTSEPY